MNDQPPVVFGYIIALGLFYVFLYYFYQAKENASKSTCSYDPTITIGYIVDDEPAYDQSFYEDQKLDPEMFIGSADHAVSSIFNCTL